MWAGAHTPPPTGDHWGFGDAEVGCVQHEARPWAAPATGRAWGRGQDGGTRAGTSHQTTTVTARSWACLLTFEKSCILDLERRGTGIQVRTAGRCLPSAHTHALRRSSSSSCSSLGTEALYVVCVRLKHFNLLKTDVEGVPWFSVTQFSHLFFF